MRYHFTVTRMSIIKKMANRCWQGCGDIGTLRHCWWDCKMVQPLRKQFDSYLININMACLLLLLFYTCYCLYLSLTIKQYEARKAQSIFEGSLYLLSYSNLLIKALTCINPSCILELILQELDYLVGLQNY